jgi:hypothetical protein
MILLLAHLANGNTEKQYSRTRVSKEIWRTYSYVVNNSSDTETSERSKDIFNLENIQEAILNRRDHEFDSQ